MPVSVIAPLKEDEAEKLGVILLVREGECGKRFDESIQSLARLVAETKEC